MKLSFFGTQNPSLDLNLCCYILSFLNLEDQQQAQLVSREWNRVVSLPSTLRSIPALGNCDLAKTDIKPLSGGMTNQTYKIDTENRQWVLRVPGHGSSAFINRADESCNARQASGLRINVAIEFFNPRDGLQLTRYLEKSQPLDKALLSNPILIQGIANVLKRLHQSTPFPNTVHIFPRNDDLLDNLKKRHGFTFPVDMALIEDAMAKINDVFSKYPTQMAPCHNDPTPGNFLLKFNDEQETSPQIHLIDWEYSGNNHFLWDLVYFALEARLSPEQELILLKQYFGEVNDATLASFTLFKPIVEWWITLWSWTQIANQANACAPDAYQQLADASYHKTKACIQSDSFQTALEALEEKACESACRFL